MIAERLITWAFLVVSLLGLLVQGWAFARIRRNTKIPKGVARTSTCRAACAVIYVVVGVNALAVHWAVLEVTFFAFCVTQATWQVNALLDVRLGIYRPAHRR